MEIRWLEDFIALARTRHFSRAAEERNVTQPTFSRRIKLLEEEMGTTLVNRQTLPLSLTPAGEEFLRLCQQVTQRVQDTRERLARLAEAQANRLRLAAPQSLLSHFLPEWLAAHHEDPPLEPYLRATGWLIDDYFQALDRGECDLVLCYWPREGHLPELERPDCDYRRVGEERLIPLSVPDPDGRPRFSLGSGPRESLPLIGFHPRGLMHAAIQGHLARLGEAPAFRVLNESIQSHNIRELIGLGYGMGWLPARLAAPALAQGELVPAGDTRWEIPLEIRLYRQPQGPAPALDRLWQALGDPLPTT
ncbi:LysR family transcriptional regulator [Halomonas sp. 328]|uniref:LysR family transcriptional regulator n=1 Tax=Halomonas sp. 328 TaxID=2776704 RepID=UPI0018A7659B|nr:LysR family transcriptional regulator [Halomonas sp. 328]MBF8221636.1 LysR family transcriptional regulator [Halomonas sp. 328]